MARTQKQKSPKLLTSLINSNIQLELHMKKNRTDNEADEKIDREELLRKLKLLKNYENDPKMTNLVALTKKWQSVARQALTDLIQESGSEEFEDESQILQRFGISPSTIGLDLSNKTPSVEEAKKIMDNDS